jgi:preprotein translocase subunit YajC
MFQAIMLQAPAQGGSAIMSIVMIVLMIVIFYFFMIRPQTKRQKELAKARDAMKPGDKVMTSGGMYGIIRDINKTNGQVTLEVWEGVKVKVDINNVYTLEETDKDKDAK